ncbi:MAG: hypothetical protein ICV79_29760 [Flavisolibacter sp.]|nr:hypothetical protein [Flavisolibacter sp.]
MLLFLEGRSVQLDKSYDKPAAGQAAELVKLWAAGGLNVAEVNVGRNVAEQNPLRSVALRNGFISV